MSEFKENEISIEIIKKVLKALGQAHRQRVKERLDADDIPDDDWIQTIKEILDRGDTYPQILSFDEFDSIPWDFEEQFGLDDDRPIEEIEKEAIALQKLKVQNYTSKSMILMDLTEFIIWEFRIDFITRQEFTK